MIVPKTVKQSHEEPDKRQRQLDAIDRLASMEPLPVPEALCEWNREYSRLKVGEAAGCPPPDDKTAT